jgi:cytochrome c oxidase cbb3-type subunit 3
MPAWGTLLPDSVIWDLVAYIRSISNAPKDEWGTTTSLDALKIEQAPAEFQSTPTPWQYTEPFTFGQKPAGEVKSGMRTE